jgi:nitrogen fixation protein FixH
MGQGDVTATVVVTATVSDLIGRPVVAGTPITFETERGTFDGGSNTVSLVVDANGNAYATLRTGPAQGSIRISARAGNAVGFATLLLGDQPYRIYLPHLLASGERPGVSR